MTRDTDKRVLKVLVDWPEDDGFELKSTASGERQLTGIDVTLYVEGVSSTVALKKQLALKSTQSGTIANIKRALAVSVWIEVGSVVAVILASQSFVCDCVMLQQVVQKRFEEPGPNRHHLIGNLIRVAVTRATSAAGSSDSVLHGLVQSSDHTTHSQPVQGGKEVVVKPPPLPERATVTMATDAGTLRFPLFVAMIVKC